MTVPLLNMEKQVRVTVIQMCNRKVGLLPLSIMLTLNASYKILIVKQQQQCAQALVIPLVIFRCVEG